MFLWIIAHWRIIMANKFKKSLAILQQEFQLQVYTVGSVIIFFTLAFAMTKSMTPVENELPKLFIGFYTMIIGLVLPWQMNTKGHISPGYCRYHLSLPVATWQLYLLPLVFRLLLISIFIGIELLLYQALYGGNYHHYLNPGNMLYFAKISLLIYLILQAYAWSKDSFKNLYLYLGIAVIICAFTKPGIISNAVENGYFAIIVLFFVALAIVGVRNLRFGKICVLPGLQNIFNLARKGKRIKEKNFKSAVATQFYYEWQRTWFYMPLGSLFAIIFIFFVPLKAGRVFKDLFITLISGSFSYVVTILLISIVGIVLIGNKGFKSSYINHLPLDSKYLAAIKLKCFSLSFAIALLLLLVSSLILYGCNGSLRDLVNAGNFELMQSPALLIWFAMALVIWSFILAFFIASVYISNRAISIILPIVALIYCFSGALSFSSVVEVAGYLPLATMVYALIAIKFGLLYLGKKKNIIKTVYAVVAFFVSFMFVLLTNQVVFLSIIPLVLIFCFPLMAYKQKILQQRHESGNVKIKLPWKLITVVSFIFMTFVIYTYVVNQQQKKKLRKIIRECETINKISEVDEKKMNVGAFISENMPYKAENIKKLEIELEKCYHRKIDISNIVADSKVCYKTIGFVCDLLDKSLENQQYSRSLNYYLFSSKLRLACKERRIILFAYRLKMILAYYTPTPEELNQLDNLLKKALYLNIKFQKKKLKQDVSYWENPDASMETYIYGNSLPSNKFMGLELRSIADLTIAPLSTSRKINYATTSLNLIKCLNYLQSEKEQDGLSIKVYTNYLSLFAFYLRDTNDIQKAIVHVAMLKYRHKYGNYPDALKLLVPEFLNKNDLYIAIYDNNDYFFRYLKTGRYKLRQLLHPNSIAYMNEYIKETKKHAQKYIKGISK
jgi:hypothetical protein